MELGPTHENFFLVILSERSESKDPYTAHSLSLGRFFDGATSAARSRRAPCTSCRGSLTRSRGRKVWRIFKPVSIRINHDFQPWD